MWKTTILIIHIILMNKLLYNQIIIWDISRSYKKSFWYKMKELLLQFQHVYDELKNRHEIAIRKKKDIISQSIVQLHLSVR